MLAHPGPVLLLSSISLKLYSPNHEEKFICFSDGMLTQRYWIQND